jgi:hypothetical protein
VKSEIYGGECVDISDKPFSSAYFIANHLHAALHCTAADYHKGTADLTEKLKKRSQYNCQSAQDRFV